MRQFYYRLRREETGVFWRPLDCGLLEGASGVGEVHGENNPLE